MKKIAVLAVMMFGFVSAAAAAPKIDVGAGYNYARIISPGSNYEETFAKDSYDGYGVFADVYITPSISVGVERSILAGFNSSNENKDFTSLRIKETGFRAKYNYELNNGISLYGLLGIGGYETSYFNDMYSYGNIGFNLGAGAKMILKGNLFAGIDLRYHFLPRYTVKSYDDGDYHKPDVFPAGTGLFVPTVFIGYSFN